jgi:hypothetical protein
LKRSSGVSCAETALKGRFAPITASMKPSPSREPGGRHGQSRAGSGRLWRIAAPSAARVTA